MAIVTFGTSGWRAIVGEEFTFRNLEVVTRAVAEVVRSEPEARGDPVIVIGYDGRFLSDAFAKTVALTFADEGIRTLLPHRPVPTPVVSMTIRAHGLSGGVILTASHNPPEYNGFKFSSATGGAATPEVTARIEERANARMTNAPEEAEFPVVRAEQNARIDAQVRDGWIEWYDPYSEYQAHLFGLVNVDLLRKAQLTVVADVLYGAGRGYLPELLREAGCEVATLHDEMNPGFGGKRPDPIAPNVPELIEQVRESSAVLGLAVDGDADRFGIVDADGTYVNANYILALVLDYLVESRGWTGEVVRTAATSHLIDAVADARGLTVYPTKTGFKYIGDRFVHAPDTFVLGGEESNGMTIRRHVPEKDGILACLLIAEMVAATGQSLSSRLSSLFARVGERYMDRLDLELPEERKRALLDRLRDDPPQSIGGLTVDAIDTLDGYKLLLTNGGFIAIRPSGTEPLVRCYLDAPSREAMETMRQGARELVNA